MRKDQQPHLVWVDVNKGILILLVVLGHWVGALNHITNGNYKWSCAMIYKVIYSFHMPAFFILAGMTWNWRPNLTFQSFLYKKSVRLLVPYFIFGIISAAIYCGLRTLFSSNMAGVSSDTYYASKAQSISFLQLLYSLIGGHGIIANSVLWFLPCMFSVVLLYFLVEKSCRACHTNILLLSGCVLLYAIFVRHDIKDLPWGFASVPKYLASFLIGRILFSQISIESLFSFLGPKKMIFAIIVLSIGYIGSVMIIPYRTLYPSKEWLCGIGIEFIYAVVGTALVIGWAYVISQSCIGTILEGVGNSSLGIMVVHKFPILAIQSRMPSFNSIEGMFVPLSIVIFAIVSGMSYMVARIIQRFMPLMLGSTKR